MGVEGGRVVEKRCVYPHHAVSKRLKDTEPKFRAHYLTFISINAKIM